MKKKSPGGPEKRALVSKTILVVLGKRIMRWGDLADQVSARLPGFQGSVPHYVVLCLADLRRQGKVRRIPGRVAMYERIAARRKA
jgi:hypothetical protein